MKLAMPLHGGVKTVSSVTSLRTARALAPRQFARHHRTLEMRAGNDLDEVSAPSKGFSILEITNKVLPQGVLVAGTDMSYFCVV